MDRHHIPGEERLSRMKPKYKDKWVLQMQALCNEHEEAMRDACNILCEKTTNFQKSRSAIFDNMERVEGKDKANKIIERGLDDMLPASLRRVIGLACMSSTPVLETSVPAAPSAIRSFSEDPIPRTSIFSTPTKQTRSRETDALGHLGPGSRAKIGTSPPGNLLKENIHPINTGTEMMGMKRQSENKRQLKMAAFFAKNSSSLYKTPSPLARENVLESLEKRPHAASTNLPAWPADEKALLEPNSPPIQTWETEGLDYIFEYKPFASGWYVLRCDQGGFKAPIKFTAHPLESGAGLKHFNTTPCVHHPQTADPYTEEEMMVKFARRVYEPDGSDVTALWAQESNEMLREKMDKENKRKRQRATLCAQSSSPHGIDRVTSSPLSEWGQDPE